MQEKAGIYHLVRTYRASQHISDNKLDSNTESTALQHRSAVVPASPRCPSIFEYSTQKKIRYKVRGPKHAGTRTGQLHEDALAPNGTSRGKQHLHEHVLPHCAVDKGRVAAMGFMVQEADVGVLRGKRQRRERVHNEVHPQQL